MHIVEGGGTENFEVSECIFSVLEINLTNTSLYWVLICCVCGGHWEDGSWGLGWRWKKILWDLLMLTLKSRLPCQVTAAWRPNPNCYRFASPKRKIGLKHIKNTPHPKQDCSAQGFSHVQMLSLGKQNKTKITIHFGKEERHFGNPTSKQASREKWAAPPVTVLLLPWRPHTPPPQALWSPAFLRRIHFQTLPALDKQTEDLYMAFIKVGCQLGHH